MSTVTFAVAEALRLHAAIVTSENTVVLSGTKMSASLVLAQDGTGGVTGPLPM